MPAARALGLALLLLSIPGAAQAGDDALRRPSLQGSSLQRLADYIAVDTTNPPGNESRGVAFFSAILDKAGIPYETAESAPGRGNIWARLEGGDEPALVLLHHMDVVPATPSKWDTNPLEAVEKDGYLQGRGTLDTKSLGIMQLQAFLALHASGKPLSRDVVFMATADEEAGGLYGAGWLVEQRPQLFENVGFLLNEGGSGSRSGDRISFGVEVAQKVPVWLRLTAQGSPGHGSMPQTTSAPGRLIAALDRIQRAPFPPRVLPPVRRMFERLAKNAQPDWREPLGNIDEAIERPGFLARLQAKMPQLHALLRNTCSITMLSGSNKINVVPPEASAELDCRVLPDQDIGAFIARIGDLAADDQIQIEKILAFSAATSSSDTDLFRLLAKVTGKHYPRASIGPTVAAGFTDSHFFRDLGITSYGFVPVAIPQSDFTGVHGNNERISIDGFGRGVEIMTEVVASFASE